MSDVKVEDVKEENRLDLFNVRAVKHKGAIIVRSATKAAGRAPRPATRAWHATTAASSTAALVVQFAAARSSLDPLIGRLLRLVEFFTVESLLFVCVSTATLAIRPQWDTEALRVLRVMGVIGVTVAGLVYATVLHGGAAGQGWWAVARHAGSHYLVPLLTVVGWIVFGPRGWVNIRTVPWVIVWFVCWCGVMLIHGAVSAYYPYPFMDAASIGYAQVMINLLLMTLLMLGVLLGGLALDHRLERLAALWRSGKQ